LPTTTFDLCVILAPGYSRLCRCNDTQQQASAGPNISLLRPELQKQWHHAKNQHLADKQITASNNMRVWWICDQCLCGLPHEWVTSIEKRQNMDTQCPYCTNNSLCQHNSLLTVAPVVAAYWDTAKNGMTADQVMARSHTRRHWLCPKCGHSWQAKASCKVDGQSGCPKCSSVSKPWNRQPSLTQSQHPAMLEFDFERNRRAGFDPDKVTAGSAKARCTGSVQNVPKANHTYLWHLHLNGWAPTLVAPAVTARRLVSATRCSRCTLR